MSPRHRAALVGVALLYLIQSCTGITWGLPGKHFDPFLFGSDTPWPGQKIYELAGGSEKFGPGRGADVDMDPVEKPPNPGAFPLNSTDADVARLYLRYRLYTNQPDEMITMMALAGMRPGRLQLDPKLYQYGGLFIYPVGALIKLCDIIGLIDVRGDVVYYLDHPDEFAKFYMVARAYAAFWGLIGVFLVFAIARRLGGVNAGLLAAMLFALLPVVVCMSHEAKPHLPGAVLMLMAVWFGIRHLQLARHVPAPRWFPDGWWMCACCGASVGMVLSSAPILVLIPLIAFTGQRTWWPCDDERGSRREIENGRVSDLTLMRFGLGVNRTIGGVLLAILTYLITNPYIVINAFTNRDVLRSNFGNSLAMYEISRIGEGLQRVLELTAEGASWPVLILGCVATLACLIRRASARDGCQSEPQAQAHGPIPDAQRRSGFAQQADGDNSNAIPLRPCAAEVLALLIPAVVFFLQFVLIGAGKPAEYGRFGIFTNTALAIATACLLTASTARRRTGDRRKRTVLATRTIAIVVTIFAVAYGGTRYLINFAADARHDGTRIHLATQLAEQARVAEVNASPFEVAVLRDPAPYCLPPINFARIRVMKYGSADQFKSAFRLAPAVLLEPMDQPDPRSTPPPHAPFAIRHSPFPRTPISWANKPFAVIQVPP